MPDDEFRLPQASYDVLTKIIMAYGAFQKPAPPSEVGKAIDIHQTTISRNGAFLVGSGILEGARTKQLTDVGRSLSRALEHDMPDEIRRSWRQIATSSDFTQKVLSAVRIRKGMERTALQSHIAYSAGQPKSPEIMRGANALIDILRAGELLRDEDGKLLAVTEEAQRTDDRMDLEPDAPFAAVAPGSSVLLGVPSASLTPNLFGAIGTGITIQIQINCSAQDIDGLGKKLRELLRQLQSPLEDADAIEELQHSDNNSPSDS